MEPIVTSENIDGTDSLIMEDEDEFGLLI